MTKDLIIAYMETIRDFQIALNACQWHELARKEYYARMINEYEQKLSLLQKPPHKS